MKKTSARRMKDPGKSGVSLLEIVVAMQCMALLLVMTCRALPLARRQMKDADQKLSSAVLAQSALEHYLTISIDEWPREPVLLEGQSHRVLLRVAPWVEDSHMMLAQVVVLHGETEHYHLETLVNP